MTPVIAGALKSTIGKVLTLPAASAALRMLGKRASRRMSCLVVNFHSIVPNDYGGLRKGPCVHTSESQFAEFLGILCRRLRPIGLDELVDNLHTGTPLPQESFVVTFDDGYADNLEVAAPVLHKLKIPATVFLATDFIGTHSIMPLDKLTFAVETTRARVLEMPEIPGGKLSLSNKSLRMNANDLLASLVKGLPASDQDAFIVRVAAKLDVDFRSMKARMLDWPQVRELPNWGLDVGSHGQSHTIMTRLSYPDAVEEMKQSRQVIFDKTGLTAKHFAYPNGQEEDFSEKLCDEARRLGYRSVLSCVSAANVPGVTNPYHVGRIGLVDEGIGHTMLFVERLLGGR